MWVVMLPINDAEVSAQRILQLACVKAPIVAGPQTRDLFIYCLGDDRAKLNIGSGRNKDGVTMHFYAQRQERTDENATACLQQSLSFRDALCHRFLRIRSFDQRLA